MGHGIAQVFALAGCEVRCYDDVAVARDSTIDRVNSNLHQAQQAGLVSEDEIKSCIANITVCDSEADSLSGAQFVTEAVREDLDVKQQLFARIESSVSESCILASNTSTFPMTDISRNMKHPERALNTHWFNPPHIVPLVEIVPGEKTAEQTTQTAIQLHERIGKLAVRLNKELPGFLVNRVQIAMLREIFDLLQQGVASAEDIDRALQSSIGLRLAAIGPLQVCDFAGVDIYSTVYGHLVQQIRSDREVPAVIKQLVAEGRLGTKSGQGIYDYTPEKIEAIRNQRDSNFLQLVKSLHS